MIFFLISLIFISKISFAFLPFVPSEIAPLIFQHGLHPYVNIFLSLSVGSLVILKWFLKPDHLYSQSRFFRFSLVVSILYLILITWMQTFFVNSEESAILQIGAAFLASFTLFLFGRVLPTQLKPETFLKYLKNLTVTLCWLSLVLLFVSPGTVFKGTRFIGIFKHIPHMVSAATLNCFAVLYFFIKESHSRRRILINTVHFLVGFSLLLITGTRSALASVILGLVIAAIIFPAKKPGLRILKTAAVITVVIATIFFGEDASQYAIDIARGEKSLAGRSAQDGVASRLEEVERGNEIFQKDQWLGQGLLSKFSTGNEADINNYNANKDPHNVFISAGVIGGWGLMVITTVLLFGLLIASLKSLKSKNGAIKILAIYMLTQIPLLVIYHLHLSIGGIADRVYWIVFGYMALKERDLERDQGIKKGF